MPLIWPNTYDINSFSNDLRISNNQLFTYLFWLFRLTTYIFLPSRLSISLFAVCDSHLVAIWTHLKQTIKPIINSISTNYPLVISAWHNDTGTPKHTINAYNKILLSLFLWKYRMASRHLSVYCRQSKHTCL